MLKSCVAEWKRNWFPLIFFFLFTLIFIIVTFGIVQVAVDEKTLLLIRFLITNQQSGEAALSVVKLCREWTTLGGFPVLLLLLFVAVAGFSGLQLWRQAVYLFSTFATATICLEGVKHLVHRARPDVVPHLVEVSSYSFPSSHSGLSAVFYLSLAIVISSRCESRIGRRILVSLGVLLLLIVGLSRVVLGVHYPTDVLAGWSIGVFIACQFQRFFFCNRNQNEFDVSQTSEEV